MHQPIALVLESYPSLALYYTVGRNRKSLDGSAIRCLKSTLLG